MLSVLDQTRGNFVVQILDNASGDDTENVARELASRDARVRYHRHGENIGSLGNLIFGIERVTTEYFSVLSDDDLLMPDFYANGLRAHERANGLLAFVSERVVVVDGHGRFDAPYPHWEGRLFPPEGIARCLTAGMSLPGTLYRTTAIRSIGVPRTAWWNWTESGWHALAAARFPIEIIPDVGAIVFVHPDSGSKKMNAMEFRTSWFRMLAEVRDDAMRNGVSLAWWRKRVVPTARARFLGTVVRACSSGDRTTYESLRTLGIASGLSTSFVGAAVRLALVARAVGVGQLLNDVIDRMAGPRRTVERAPDSFLNAAAQVFHDLNRRAGLPRQG